jgi:hypothetical protein
MRRMAACATTTCQPLRRQRIHILFLQIHRRSPTHPRPIPHRPQARPFRSPHPPSAASFHCLQAPPPQSSTSLIDASHPRSPPKPHPPHPTLHISPFSSSSEHRNSGWSTKRQQRRRVRAKPLTSEIFPPEKEAELAHIPTLIVGSDPSRVCAGRIAGDSVTEIRPTVKYPAELSKSQIPFPHELHPDFDRLKRQKISLLCSFCKCDLCLVVVHCRQRCDRLARVGGERKIGFA